MKKIFLFWLMTFQFGFSQNLILNNSFENGSSSKPTLEGELGSCDSWETLRNGTSGECSSSIGSSPDWFRTADGFFRIFDITGGHTGQCYVGTAANLEIVQQKLPQKLTTGLHRIKMFVRRGSNSMRPICTPLPSSTNPSTFCRFTNPCEALPHKSLNIFLSSSKMSYVDGDNVGATGNNTKVGNLQPSLKIDLPTDVMTDWIEVRAQFVNTEENLQWIGIEGLGNSGYTLIDDVSLEKISPSECAACENGGAINVTIVNSFGNPLKFKGLGNITNFKLTANRISNPTTPAYREFELKNPNCEFTFNHRREDGLPIEIVPIRYDIRVSNNCDFKKISFTSAHDLDLTALPPNSYLQGEQNYSKVNLSASCCQDELKLVGGMGGTYLTGLTNAGGADPCLNLSSYISLSMQNPAVYPKLTLKARKVANVYAFTTLKNIDIKAPKIILEKAVFMSSMAILGGTFTAINDCPPPITPLRQNDADNQKAANDASKNKAFLLENGETGSVGEVNPKSKLKIEGLKDGKYLDNLEEENYRFDLFPNPNSGKFTLVIEANGSISDYEMSVSDSQGKVIYNSNGTVNVNKEIELASLMQGIYFVKVVVGDKILFKRFSKI